MFYGDIIGFGFGQKPYIGFRRCDLDRRFIDAAGDYTKRKAGLLQ
jgi:hypothetical protein